MVGSRANYLSWSNIISWHIFFSYPLILYLLSLLVSWLLLPVCAWYQPQLPSTCMLKWGHPFFLSRLFFFFFPQLRLFFVHLVWTLPCWFTYFLKWGTNRHCACCKLPCWSFCLTCDTHALNPLKGFAFHNNMTWLTHNQLMIHCVHWSFLKNVSNKFTPLSCDYK